MDAPSTAPPKLSAAVPRYGEQWADSVDAGRASHVELVVANWVQYI